LAEVKKGVLKVEEEWKTLIASVIGLGFIWLSSLRKKQSEARLQQIIALEKYLCEIETEAARLRRLCGDFPPSTGENKMANNILSVIRRWRVGANKS